MRRNLRALLAIFLQPVGTANKVYEVLNTVVSLLLTVGLAAALVGSAIGVVKGVLPGLYSGLAIFSFVLFLLMFRAAYRLQSQVAKLQAPVLIPTNRDALIEVLTELEKAALAVVAEYRVSHWLREEHPGVDRKVDRSLHDNTNQWLNRLDIQTRIAGQVFSDRLHMHRSMIWLETERLRYSDEQENDDPESFDYDEVRDMITSCTKAILLRIDAAQLAMLPEL